MPQNYLRYDPISVFQVIGGFNLNFRGYATNEGITNCSPASLQKCDEKNHRDRCDKQKPCSRCGGTL